MKISLEQYGHKASYECEADDLTSTDVLQVVRGLMITMTWHDSSVIDGMKEIVENYEKLKNWEYESSSGQ